MFELVYKRREAGIIDLRVFQSIMEFENWFRTSVLEPIDIIDVRYMKEES